MGLKDIEKFVSIEKKKDEMLSRYFNRKGKGRWEVASFVAEPTITMRNANDPEETVTFGVFSSMADEFNRKSLIVHGNNDEDSSN